MINNHIDSEKVKSNNLGFMRLLFASLVIISHSSELIHGNRAYEPLFFLTGTLSLGDLAVNGFFIISGYLIAKSYINRKSDSEYLIKRVMRIYPGFSAAWLFSALVVLPLAGGQENIPILHDLWKIAILKSPTSAEVFSGTFFPSLNAPLWTIPWEFFCYILVIFLSYAKVLRFRGFVIVASLFILVMPYLLIHITKYIVLNDYFGTILNGSRLIGMFLSGTVFLLYKDSIKYNKLGILISAIIILATIRFSSLASVGIATGGAYIIFFVGMNFQSKILSSVNSKNDVSYGVYLYAWPISKLLILYFSVNNFPILCILTFLIAAIFGYISWLTIERPFINIGKRINYMLAYRTNTRL